MKLIEIIKRNRVLGADLKADYYEIAVLSNITVPIFSEVLELKLREKGIYAKVTVGNYDAIIQDSMRFSNFKAVLVFWEASNLIEGLQHKCFSMPSEQIDALEARVEGEIELMLNNLKNIPLVLVNRFSSKIFCTDVLDEDPLTILCRRLNERLVSKVHSNQIIVDLDKVLVKVGHAAAVDLRQYQSSKALYSIEFFRVYAEAVMPAFMAVNGRAKKILILDCDNTLWGGILGEDGFNSIEMSDSSIKGNSFHQVQTILKGFRRNGVLLALCSKNNQTDVEHVLNHHPHMILKNKDFVAKKINWKDKATNLRELASELNIGLDSFVFVDDSSFEIGLIEKELPEVLCIQVPKNISEYPSVIKNIRKEFFNISRTPEDVLKTEMYQQEHIRKEHSNQFKSLDDYLASLELKIKTNWNSKIPIPRAAQLTQKTNQFNLTTNRYTEADIDRMINDKSYRIATFNVEDNYGDYGVTGLIIIQISKNSPTTCIVDNFLMSCRIIGRNIEYFIFNELVKVLKANGIEKIIANYKATAKNSQVSKFYDELGFNLVSKDDLYKNYEIYINNFKPKLINYIKHIEELNHE